MTEAVALAIKAVAEMVTEIVKGQSAEVKKQIWEWYVKDVAELRKASGMDK